MVLYLNKMDDVTNSIYLTLSTIECTVGGNYLFFLSRTPCDR